MPLPVDWQLGAELERLAAEGLRRSVHAVEGSQGGRIVIDGRELLNFSSNDYLGLAAHPEIRRSLKAAVDRYGVGSGASHLVCGHSTAHAELEDALAILTSRPRVLLYSTGYMANLGVAGALLGRHDTLLQDKLNHASLLDAAAVSGARLQRYRHADTDHLQDRLKTLARAESVSRVLVSSDSVFSMDGDVPDLERIALLCSQHQAALQLDDAHGLGVMGATGAGACEAAGLDIEDVPILMGTFGKALGTSGAFVAGSEELIETLLQTSRTHIYTTAMPPALAAATCRSIELLDEEAWRREHLQQLIRYFKSRLADTGFRLMPSESAIQPLLVGGSNEALRLSASLRKRGILAVAIRPPTVPAGQARLRLTLSAAHSEQDVGLLCDALEAELKVGSAAVS